MTNTTPPPPITPAGWYDDGQGRMRWWNGAQWTDAYAPVVVQHPKAPMNPFSILGFVAGLIAVLLFSAGPAALGLGVLGLIASVNGARDAERRGKGFAVAGLVLCGIAILIGALGSVRLFTGS